MPGFDWAGLALLAVTTTGWLLALSTLSGLPVPGWAALVLFVLATGAGWAFVVRQRRAPAPLLDLALLRVRAVSTGLAGALAGYLVLFGPLVLVPVVLARGGVSTTTAGLVLTALPAGFAVAATGANRVLPRAMSDRTPSVLGTGICAAALAAALCLPLTPVALVPLLAVLGLGLGTFLPANNAMIMGAVPAASSGTGGGLVNMTRGLGTALGVALVTLALHLAGAGAGRWAVLVLLAVALAAVGAAAAGPAAVPPGPRRRGGRDEA
ncbi:MFS transporter [Streptomyces albicerus]|uniref:hypothetical protein n=1 Tax=Streptomyces albicerus TaxID=2569859 RepID=UPI001788CC0C|nr:hypothetical protein [Streptomyces albicerus]